MQNMPPKIVISRVIKIIFALALVGIIYFAIRLFIEFNNKSKETQRLSAMAEMYVGIRDELPRYYQTNGHYPAELKELAVSSQKPNGLGTSLEKFSYHSVGKAFILKWRTPDGRDIYLEGQNGITTKDDW